MFAAGVISMARVDNKSSINFNALANSLVVAEPVAEEDAVSLDEPEADPDVEFTEEMPDISDSNSETSFFNFSTKPDVEPLEELVAISDSNSLSKARSLEVEFKLTDETLLMLESPFNTFPSF